MFGRVTSPAMATRMGRLDLIITTPDIYTSKAGNTPVAPLVLHGVVGCGNHLPSGDPNARLLCLFHKKRSFYKKTRGFRFPRLIPLLNVASLDKNKKIYNRLIKMYVFYSSLLPYTKYCSYFLFLFLAFYRIHRRAIRIIGDPTICERLDTLALRRDVSSLCVLYRIYHHGSVLKNCLTCYLSPNFLTVQFVTG